MLIVAHVAAEFYDEKYNRIFRIDREEINQFMEAPDELLKNAYFNMLVEDGSIQIPETVKARKSLEMDPTATVNAEGKKKEPAKTETTAKATEKGKKAGEQ